MKSEPFICRAPHGLFIVKNETGAIDVTLRGEFDLSGNDASQFVIEHVGELLDAVPRPIAVEMSAVSFFDAVGIRFLLQLERLAELCSTTSTVRNATPEVRRLLDVVGLQRMLKEPSAGR